MYLIHEQQSSKHLHLTYCSGMWALFTAIGSVMLKGQCVGIEAMQSHMISLPVKSLMCHKFTIIYKVYN